MDQLHIANEENIMSEHFHSERESFKIQICTNSNNLYYFSTEIHTTNEARVFEHFLLCLVFASEVSKGVDDDTKNEVEDDNDDNEEEEKIV